MAYSGKFNYTHPEFIRIAFSNIEVKGVYFRIKAAKQFILGKDHGIELCPEPENIHDANAIAIYGHWKGWFFKRRKLIGYVPAELAKKIAEMGITYYVVGYPKNFWLGGYVRDVAYIRIDIGVPTALLPLKVKKLKTKKKKQPP